ncbi:MAG: acyl-ACP--UDP-N-acetylglucosamine O-acyltransferase, partial [Pseudomonadota bacterium]
MSIHPTAVVAPSAVLSSGVTVGPHAVVDGEVELGPGVSLGPGAVVTGRTRIGEGTVLHAGAIVGGPPQDLSHNGEPVTVEIGARCILREHVTVHAGTARGRARTVIGDDCFLMVGAHVGHDCIVGDHVVLSNNVLLAGHSTLGDYVLIGGGAAIVQRVRIGAHAFISGLSGVTKDVVPFAYVIGHRGRLDSLNLVGLKRRGFSREAIHTLLHAYAILFDGEGLFRDRLTELRGSMGHDSLVETILTFIDEGRGRPLL